MDIVRITLASVVFTVGFVSPTSAMTGLTGAEFVLANKTFSQGFAWGVLEHELAQFSSDSKQRRERKRKLDACLVVNPINAEMLDSLVRTHINANPIRTAEPALRGVLNVLAEICDYNR